MGLVTGDMSIDGGADFRHVRVTFFGRSLSVNKRSLSLSVLAFTSAMLAAPYALAQGNGTDTSTSSTTTTTDNSAVTATDAAKKPDEVSSLFTSSYTPEKDKASEKKPTEQLRWAGTQYFQQFGVSPDVFAPGLVQTYAPVVDTFMLFQPRFTLTKDWQLRARITANVEFTDNANSTTTASRTIVFGDVTPSLVFKGIPTFAGIKMLVSAGAALPTSPASQARTLILNPFLNLTFDRKFEKAAGGEFEVAVSSTFYHPFYRYTTAGLDSDPMYQPQCFGAGDVGCGLQSTGAANTENALSFLLTVSQTWGKWNPGAFFLLSNSWDYQFANLPGVEPEPNGKTAFRQTSYFNIFLDYNATDWFTAEVGYQIFRTILDGESQIGNPFWDPYQDMRVYLGFNIGLDALYEALQGKKEEAGILRTKSERRPYGVF
jgi:hypothetical protein